MVSMSSWMLSVKLVLISTGVASLAMGIKLSVPVALDGIPALWSAVLLWMKPPYLYIIINGIIITIVASSRFHQSQAEAPAVRSEHLVPVRTPPSSSYPSFSAQMTYVSSSGLQESTVVDEVVVSEMEEAVGELKSMPASSPMVESETQREVLIEAESIDVLSNSFPEAKFSPEVHFESRLPVREKPLVSSRLGHRKPIRSHPEVSGGRALRVARPKRHETLENTWKMITEGRHVPLTRHLKRSDVSSEQEIKLKEGGHHINPTARIGKEASLGQDELNRRVEAFIKKFNEEMRMQRQESLNKFMEMINRGV